MPFSITAYLMPVVVLAITLMVLNYRNDSLRNPAMFLILTWIGVISTHGFISYLQIMPLYPSGIVANFLSAISVISFAISFFLVRPVFRQSHARRSLIDKDDMHNAEVMENRTQDERRGKWLDWILIGFSIVVLYGMYRAASGIVGSSDVFSQLQLLRSQLNYEDADWGGVQYAAQFVVVATVYIGTRNIERGRHASIRAYILLLISLVVSLLSSQRTSILFIIIAFFFARSRKGIPSTKVLITSGFLFFLLFVFSGFLVGKIGGAESGLSDTLQRGWDSFLFYLLSPLSAFNYAAAWVDNAPHAGFTTRFLFKLFEVIGLQEAGFQSLVLPFIDVPFPTNVYTFSHSAILDFGYLFVIYFGLVGAIYGYEFSFERNSSFHRSLQAFMYYPIVMSVFQDQFFTIFSQWIQIIIWLFVLQHAYRDSPRMLSSRRISGGGATSPPVGH